MAARRTRPCPEKTGRPCKEPSARLWGPAQNYLDAALARQDRCATRLALARLAEACGRDEEALPNYRAAALLQN